MITWDVEGEEFPSATYIGDPRLTTKLAPETDFIGSSKLAAIDAYFQKFHAAGFRVGVTLRPQDVVFENGIPRQTILPDPEKELLDKIAYARERWNCTLFYVDSTYDASGHSLSADIFRKIAEKYPDILLIPEHKNTRDYAYSAPLISFDHHGVAQTPNATREAYNSAFSVIMATVSGADKMAARKDALIEAVRHGDILLVNAWYEGAHTEFIKRIYADAKAK